MSDHVLLNLLNEVRKRDQMRGLPSILTHFCNKLNGKIHTFSKRIYYKAYSMAGIIPR